MNNTTNIKSVFITGANAGLGKDSARQFALLDTTEKIYLGCRNEEKAKVAKLELEQVTGKSIFEIVIIDVSNLDSVRAAVAGLNEPIDALVMNAGGMGGTTPERLTVDGVTQMFAVNVLGHALLLDELVHANKLTQVAIYAGSEAARGVKKMGIKRPSLDTGSVAEFQAIADGSYFGDNFSAMNAYGIVKYIAALWMSAAARQYQKLRVVTVSPGGTDGTNVMDDLPQPMRFMFQKIGTRLMPRMGLMHPLEVGAKRYVDVVTDDAYKSGTFYASKEPVVVGPMVDQATILADFNNKTYQDNANEAIHTFFKVSTPVAA